MKRVTFISILALLVSVAGLVVALVSYFKRCESLFDSFEDDLLAEEPDDIEYYSSTQPAAHAATEDSVMDESF